MRDAVVIKDKNKKLAKLEAVRGFAVTYVVLHHLFLRKCIIFGRNYSVFFRFGQEAVIIFFLLSGFVIYLAYDRSKDKSFKIFFWKRFLRIYIPFICVLIVSYLLFALSKKEFASINWLTLLGNLFMLQDMATVKPNVIVETFLKNIPLWSLSYEFWFYMVFFFIKNKFKDNASKVVYILGTISALTYLVYPNFFNRELMYLNIWWIGADLCILYINKKEINFASMKLSYLVLIVNIAILMLNIKLNNHNGTIGTSPFIEFRHFAFALLALTLVIVWNKLNWYGFSVIILVFEPIASISFGIYISHWFLFVHAHYFDTVIANIYLRYLAYFVICIAFSFIVEKVIYIKLNKFIMSKVYRVK